MTDLHSTLSQDYISQAENLLAEWVVNEFPETVSTKSMPMDSVIPWGFLVCRPMPTNPANIHRRQGNGGSCTVVPEIHFWHEDGRLVIFEGFPREYMPVSFLMRQGDARQDIDLKEKTFPDVVQGALEIINAWMSNRDEGKGGKSAYSGFDCCGRFLSDDGKWSGEVYAHDHHESDGWSRRPQLFPSLMMHYVAEAARIEAMVNKNKPMLTWWELTFKPIFYDLAYVGTFIPVMEQVPDGLFEGETPAES